LYDGVDDPVEDFTEKDLSDNKKTPVKAQEQQNPYMDSELSETIGKLSKSIGNRKQINTS